MSEQVDNDTMTQVQEAVAELIVARAIKRRAYEAQLTAGVVLAQARAREWRAQEQVDAALDAAAKAAYEGSLT